MKASETPRPYEDAAAKKKLILAMTVKDVVGMYRVI
jgi:hypothetical protein